MALDIYATSKSSFEGRSPHGFIASEKLPSPDEVKPTFELVWSADTGRSIETGSSQAKMIGDVVGEKRTYAIKWGVITDAQMDVIKARLTKGFFYFGLGTTLSGANTSASLFYRSEIAGEYMPVGNEIYWKGVTVSVIEQ